MRIIAGTARRLPLKTLEGRDTRPTADRIKETLFNMLHTGMPGSRILDLFAGTGQIGLEALSRGADYAVFVDNSRKACACIQDNIRFTRFEKQSEVLRMDALLALRSLEGNHVFDYIFMDPPYGHAAEKEILEYLADSSLLTQDTVIIAEASLDTGFSYVPELGMAVRREKKYKTNKHLFITKEA